MTFDDVSLARTIHVLAVVLWIGGVGFVTTVLFGAIRRTNAPEARLSAFLAVEERFAGQARIAVALAGLSGLWMVYRLDLWDRFQSLRDYWWVHAMVLVWLAFAMMLYVAEPLVLHRRLAASRDPARAFQRMERLHWALLLLSLIAVFGAVGGVHGLF